MAAANPDIATLLTACRRGDVRAQETFYRRFFPLLLPICLRYLPTRQAAVPVLNQAMLRIFQSLDGYREEGALEGWLVTVTRNTVLTHLRDESRAQRRMLEGQFVWPAEVPNDALDQLAVEDILKLLVRLPDHLRVVFSLVVFDEYTHAEVATALDITETASRWRLRKARQLLQAAYLATHQIKSGS
ncbi:RNA polymerase sigma factor [Neolewinella sp.]|uniref:RNA polymerase sigma factor n=1 Tax=Neolewinella sp. TaxID=2993543 RepID=UPI003B522901